LIYSTWLVLGCLEVALGLERVINTPPERQQFLYTAITIAQTCAGATLLFWAQKAATVQNKRVMAAIRNMTVVLFLLILGAPFFTVTKYSIAVIVGGAEVDAPYARGVIVLGLVEIGYAIAVIWAGYKLRRIAQARDGDDSW
jgi:hypothetical protein